MKPIKLFLLKLESYLHSQ